MSGFSQGKNHRTQEARQDLFRYSCTLADTIRFVPTKHDDDEQSTSPFTRLVPLLLSLSLSLSLSLWLCVKTMLGGCVTGVRRGLCAAWRCASLPLMQRSALGSGPRRTLMAAGGKNGLARPNVAIAGATGAVGVDLLNCLDKRNFPFNNLKLLASSRSAGKEMEFQGKAHVVEELTEDSFKDVDIALFSAGGSQSKRYAPAAVEAGCIVVDNSSAFRMDPDTPLVVPEVNPEAVQQHKGIIANPNCSTIILNVAVWPLHQRSPIERIVCATYQAASGAGAAAMRELEMQAHAFVEGKPMNTEIFGRQYLWNLFSHNASVDSASGYNEEEIKMMRETKKIFGEDNLHITATCIRVPVLRAHCEAINLTFS